MNLSSTGLDPFDTPIDVAAVELALRQSRVPSWVKDDTRFYTIAGRRYPSVTSVLKVVAAPALESWKMKTERETWLRQTTAWLASTWSRPQIVSAVHDLAAGRKPADAAETQSAAALGTAVHGAIEWALKGELGLDPGPAPKLTPEAARLFAAWSEWWPTSGFRALGVERTVWSRAHKFAGTVDLVAERDGRVLVLDWKTSRSLGLLEYQLQNRAYRMALAELGEPTHGGVLVRIPKDGSDIEEEPVPESVTVEDFLATLHLWRAARRFNGQETGE